MPDPTTLAEVVARFGRAAKDKFDEPAVAGNPEDQLRAPLEGLVTALAALTAPAARVRMVGETRVTELQVRPDYAVTVGGALTGFIELKAPGKGYDPRRFTDPHDKAQWEKLRALPNLLYTDGNGFTLWRDGRLEAAVALEGDVRSAGARLSAPDALLRLVSAFLTWTPIAPNGPQQLAEVSARLCRLLRDEVTEQLERGSEALTALADGWRRLLFPTAQNAEFADGYAQAVTFGLLMARARRISLQGGLGQVADQLRTRDTLIGAALRLLTEDQEANETLKTSLATLTRVLGVVEWDAISRGDPEAWLYFYEHFLAVYDNDLRKKTGSYYTPPQVVGAMVRLVDDALRDPGLFGVARGLGASEVILADPATGTGTYLLGILRHIAARLRADGQEGRIAEAVRSALPRLIGFEMQFGPFAVAQLRLAAELIEHLGEEEGAAAAATLRLYITDTLGNPFAEEESLPGLARQISESRRRANRIKREEPIFVVLGNPPYKVRAKPLGGWIVTPSSNRSNAPIQAWIPPPEWDLGEHVKHLHNLYVYFWRWATWKVFGEGEGAPRRGMVCFITAAGFLNGEGFQQMRAALRGDCDEIWVVDCTPDGHQPPVQTRIFQGVQQPVCIVMAARTGARPAETSARVRFLRLPEGRREDKFAALEALRLDAPEWQDCPAEPRAPFLPVGGAGWGSMSPLTSLFCWDGSGVMPGRTWVIAPDAATLQARWRRLLAERDPVEKERLFRPHEVRGQVADRHINKVLRRALPGVTHSLGRIAQETALCTPPARYAFRSFDRQWIIPDNRVINRPNPTLWALRSDQQVFMTTLVRHAPTAGPAITFSGLIPDHDHYKGSFAGRVFPLWLDQAGTVPNVRPGVLAALAAAHGRPVEGADLFAWIAAIAAHPAYVDRFRVELVQPGLRIPLPAEAETFAEGVRLGREVLWLHTFGERFSDAAEGRPPGPPRLPTGQGPRMPAGSGIPGGLDRMPDRIDYDAERRRLVVGEGWIENVPPEVWAYEVSGKQVLVQWFSYRGKDRSRPQIGDIRDRSALDAMLPEQGWLADYTDELLDLLHVLGRLVALESAQAALLERTMARPLLAHSALEDAGAYAVPAEIAERIAALGTDTGQANLF